MSQAVSLKATWFRDKLRKKRKQGFRGYPLATVAHYGPDDKRATKVTVGVFVAEGEDVAFLRKWHVEAGDVRSDPKITEEIVRMIEAHAVRSVAAADRIIGCPHEEGIDYPEGQTCPQCPFWAHRDRWTGEVSG